MDDPSNICLGAIGGGVSARRDVYALIHLANVIRKNVLLIAPGIDAKGFSKFVHGPNKKTRDAMGVAVSQLPKTITKSVVSCLGKYHVEDKSNVDYCRKFRKIFMRNNKLGVQAAEFFMKNLTTARCNGIVFIMQPYLVLRYDLKRRDSWFDRCRFIWISCALFRLPTLLPVLAAQLTLYTIKMFIQEPSFTRKEEFRMLEELVHFLPGLANVAKPPFGVSLSVWYRNMARHRKIALEAILAEANNRGDLQYHIPPYSMIMFDSMQELISYIEDELKYCDEQETMEKSDQRKYNAAKDPFDDDSELDDEDKELLQLGGYRLEREEDVEEEEIVEYLVEMEDIVEYEDVTEEYVHEDEEEYSEAHIKIFQNSGKNITNGFDTRSREESDREGSVPGNDIPLESNCQLLKKITEDDVQFYFTTTFGNGWIRSTEKGYEGDGDKEISSRSGIVEDEYLLEGDDIRGRKEERRCHQ
ncbi:hypothetical protein PMAYCL1PPCAC_23610 [Pristionchus mayeri]|uniref:Uncharacterized protein n=1 Tax=Pristionchus mayeri TaxID=1317129 RepID=A0AAN5I6U7_9BILA|nr:hypothetical protein PMAYCL1PPCAC_23610 [Pristionchus mayeri]